MSAAGPAARSDGGHRVVLATANAHKVIEITELLGGVMPLWHVIPRPTDVPEIVEDADSFLGNARLKAVALSNATGAAAIADDSGLVVDALGGRPGVHSARYGGPGASDAINVAKLLDELSGVGAHESSQRSARFMCVIVVAFPDGSEAVATGKVEGFIADEANGEGGFGYDPVFVPLDGDGRTFAQMSSTEKAAISHRGRALRHLGEVLGAG